MKFVLNDDEKQELFRQDPSKKRNGGFQSLMVGLQENYDPVTGAVEITAKQKLRISKYAFSYGGGGWEKQLLTSFGRHLGPKLDGNNES